MLSFLANTYFILNIIIIISSVGFVGILFNRKNILIILMSVELILLSINFNFGIFSIQLDDFIGQIFILFILTVAAAESALGLGLIITNYKLFYSIEFKPVKKKLTAKF